ncbi:hypothetical protein F4801DRAFT_580379 [Xylaria longipes]|nr:hypothetical protein F4801DRAFT_580379 [Xylaria longipes]
MAHDGSPHIPTAAFEKHHPRMSQILPRYAQKRCFLLFLVVAAFLSAAVSLSLYLPTPSWLDLHFSTAPLISTTHADHALVLNCGTSREEAIANGCTLDIMGGAWIPAACYDAEEAREALDPTTMLISLTGPSIFDWYSDPRREHPVTLEELSALGNLRAYTWQVYHVAHCIYSWRKTTRALNRVRGGERDVYVHSKLLTDNHTYHCAMVLAASGGEEGSLRGSPVELQIGLGECARLDLGGS